MRKGEKLKFKTGQSVKVKEGTLCPDNEKFDLSGWQGRIFEIDEDLIGINWDSVTLENMPEKYIIESEKDGLDWSTMYLNEDEIEPAKARDSVTDTDAEREKLEKKYYWIEFGPEGEIIQSVANSAESDSELNIMKAWHEFLKRKLVFPFEAVVDEYQSKSPLKQGDKLSVLDIEIFDDHYGIIISCRKGRRKYSFPLVDLEVEATDENKKYVEAYRTWFSNRI